MSESIKQLIHAARFVGDRSSQRYIAAVVDQIVAYGCAFGGAISLQNAGSFLRVNFSPLIVGLSAYAWYLAYFALTEWCFSTTPGKYFFSLRIQSLSDGPCTLKQALIRTAARIVEVNPILLGALPAILFIKFSQRGQRLGDMLSGTLVVSTDKAI